VPNPLIVLNYARELRGAGDPSSVSAFEDAQAAASRAGDWTCLYHGFAGVGKLHLNRNEPDKATPWYEEAERVARRGGLTLWQAPALHDLYLCCTLAGEETRGRQYVRDSLDLYYEQRHPRMFALIHDMEFVKLMRGDRSGMRNALLTPIAYAKNLKSEDVLLPFSNLLYAAGMQGAEDTFNNWMVGFEEALVTADGEGVALSLLGASRGARALDNEAQARSLLLRAQEVATVRNETALLRDIESMLQQFSQLNRVT
jgi:hypothetical protein